LTDKPAKPRPKKHRKPARRKVLSPAQLQSESLEKAARALTMEELACAHLCVEYSPEHAAGTLAWDLAAVREVWNRPAVQRYVMESQTVFLHKLASKKIRLLEKVGVTASNIEQRLMQIAMMDPDETKGNVDGQVKALRTLAEMLHLLEAGDPLKGKTPEQMKAMVQQASAKLIEGKAETRPQ
jgi:hypothetical protein